jgi:hypothetical protein
MKNDGYTIQQDNEHQICIIPEPFIGSDEFFRLLQIYNELGYEQWLPADERGGYILSKIPQK